MRNIFRNIYYFLLRRDHNSHLDPYWNFSAVLTCIWLSFFKFIDSKEKVSTYCSIYYRNIFVLVKVNTLNSDLFNQAISIHILVSSSLIRIVRPSYKYSYSRIKLPYQHLRRIGHGVYKLYAQIYNRNRKINLNYLNI